MTIDRRALLGWTSGLSALAALPAAARTTGFDAALDAAARIGSPAVGGGVVTREGLVWSGVRGVRRADGSDPVLIGDRWHLGSNTKAMTAAVFARLVEQRRARWDLTLAQAFPGMALDPAWRDVPVEALMRHRAGLTDEPVLGRMWLMTARADPKSLPEQRAALAASALSRPPAGEPGAFAYANLNYIIVGAVIEAIVGAAWEDVMRAQLFEPLGLASAGFGPPPDPNAWGHVEDGGRLTPMDPANPYADNPAALGPAGTVHMTIADYARWTQALCGGDWLSADSLARLGDSPETTSAYALGWMVLPAPPVGLFAGADRLLGHEGSNTMWHAVALIAPAMGSAVFTFANDETRGATAAQTLAQRLAVLTA